MLSKLENGGTLNEIVYEGLHQLAAQIKYNNKQIEKQNTGQTSPSSIDRDEMLERLQQTIGLVYHKINSSVLKIAWFFRHMLVSIF